MYWNPAVPVNDTVVVGADAVKSMVKGVHVLDVLVAVMEKGWLVPPADAVISTGGPPHRLVYEPR
jgi:hypothetical protein